MTVETQAIKAVYVGNGASTAWAYGFLIPTLGELRLSLIDNASGNVTVVNPVNYTATGIGQDAGGTVTYPLSGSPLAVGFTLVIERVMPYTQEITFANQGAAYPADIEDGLDALVLQIQQLADAVGRSIVFSVADSVEQTLPLASARANMQLGFDALGAPIAVAGIVPNVQVSSAMVPVITAPSTAAALTALGLPGALLNLLIPAGTIWDYALTTAPTGFLFPIGQTCTSTYPVLRAALIAAGSPYGTTGSDPLMPDLRSAVVAGKSNMGGADNGGLPGGTVLGAVLGSATRTIAQNQLPNITPTASSVVFDPAHTHVYSRVGASVSGFPGGGTNANGDASTNSALTGISVSTTVSSINGNVAQQTISVLQLTFICNKIIKVH